MNIYRTIGGRVNATGVERIDRDGQMEVLKQDEVEVTPAERTRWYNKAKIDVRGNTPEEVYDVEKGDTNGNSMAVDVEHRTMLPRKHQFSTEARLNDQRGTKPEFHKSDASIDNAVGVMTGAIIPNIPDRSEFDEAGKTTIPGKQKKKDNPVSCETEASSSSTMKKDSKAFKMASAFEAVSKIAVKTAGSDLKLSTSEVISISDETGVSVEDVFLLERVAQSNPELAGDYASAREVGVRPERKRRRLRKTRTEIPGTEPKPGGFDKESDEENQENLNATALKVGLIP